MKGSIWAGLLAPPALIVTFAVAWLWLPGREWTVVLIGVAVLVAVIATGVELIALPFAIRALRRNPGVRTAPALLAIAAGFISLALGVLVLAEIVAARLQ